MEKALVEERFKDIEENYKRIRENIQKATLESGRDEGSVRLMGVTKTVDSLYINHGLLIMSLLVVIDHQTGLTILLKTLLKR